MLKSTLRFIPVAAAILFIVFTAYAASDRPGSAAGQNDAGDIPVDLPSIVRGAQTESSDATNGLVTLSFDDGTCESGLGLGAPHTALVEFDVPCMTQPGFSIVQLTARVNTGTAISFTLRQAGATPGTTGSGTNVGISNIFGAGPCPATGFTTRAVTPGAVVTGTSNFFAGVNYGSAGGFIGRDTNSTPAMRQWLNCPTCGMSIYSPADLTGIGFPGNFLIRVTGEDTCYIPVELIELTVKPE